MIYETSYGDINGKSRYADQTGPALSLINLVINRSFLRRSLHLIFRSKKRGPAVDVSASDCKHNFPREDDGRCMTGESPKF